MNPLAALRDLGAMYMEGRRTELLGTDYKIKRMKEQADIQRILAQIEGDAKDRQMKGREAANALAFERLKFQGTQDAPPPTPGVPSDTVVGPMPPTPAPDPTAQIMDPITGAPSTVTGSYRDPEKMLAELEQHGAVTNRTALGLKAAEGALPLSAAEREKLAIERSTHLDAARIAAAAASARGNKPRLTKMNSPETGEPGMYWVTPGEDPVYAGAATLNATTANRADSAKTLIKVGDDIRASLRDPATRAALGPALGRFNTLREFIGNPPPEFARLAGEIESFSLANMGLHGMRSVQGAEKIKALLDARHTPESLIASLDGLLNFAHNFVEVTGAAGSNGLGSSGDTTTRPPDLIWNGHALVPAR